MDVKKFFNRFYKQFNSLDVILVVIFGLLLSGFVLFFMRKSEMVQIRVRVTDQDALFAWTNPPNWYAYAFKAGDKESDSLGRVLAEIIAVEQIGVTSETKAVYLDMNVRATFDPRTKRYTFKGKNLAFGTPIRFNLQQVFFDSIVVKTPYTDNEFSNVRLKVVAEGYDIRSFLAIQAQEFEGKSVISNSGQVYLTIDSVRVEKSKSIYRFLDIEQVLLQEAHDYKDVAFELTIYAKKSPYEYFIYEDIPIKVGEMIPIHFPEMTFFPTVTKIEQVDE